MENGTSSGLGSTSHSATELSAVPLPVAAQPVAQEEPQHPFETDPGDHAETPFEAYQHLDLLLARLAKRLGTTKAALRIYDPFYCEGRMVQHLAGLGYESVYNRNEDFYEVKAAGRCPEYDVLVTNPPFSGDHLERIFQFAVKSDKPWCLLVPQYVWRKAFFLEWINNHRPKGCPKPSFLAPTRQPYVFTAPDRADVREMRLPDQAAASAPGGSTVAAPVEAALAALSLGACAGPGSTEPAAEPAPPTPAAGAAAGEWPKEAAAAAAAAAASRRTAVSPVKSSAPSATPAAAGSVLTAFDVAAGSFQCVWFFQLGERHHKPVFEWLQQQLQQQHQAGASAAGDCDAVGPAFTVVATAKEVPQLMAVPKLSPAERRWRKKLAAAGGQLPAEDGLQQQQQQRGGGGGSGRQGGRQSSGSGSGRQQRQQGAGRQAGGSRHQLQPVAGAIAGGRPVAGRMQHQQHGSAGVNEGRPAASREQAGQTARG